MIVYNVLRRWFTEKAAAQAYRKAEGLKPSALAKVTVNSRDDLAALLNALCEPSGPAALQGVASPEVLDRAWIDPKTDISEVPTFLLKGRPEYADEVKRREQGGVFG